MLSKQFNKKRNETCCAFARKTDNATEHMLSCFFIDKGEKYGECKTKQPIFGEKRDDYKNYDLCINGEIGVEKVTR